MFSLTPNSRKSLKGPDTKEDLTLLNFQLVDDLALKWLYYLRFRSLLQIGCTKTQVLNSVGTTEWIGLRGSRCRQVQFCSKHPTLSSSTSTPDVTSSRVPHFPVPRVRLYENIESQKGKKKEVNTSHCLGGSAPWHQLSVTRHMVSVLVLASLLSCALICQVTVDLCFCVPIVLRTRRTI